MADIVYTGGTAAASGGGYGGIIKDLMPLIVVGGIGYLAYSLLKGGGAVQDTGGLQGNAYTPPQGNSQISQANTGTQASQNDNSMTPDFWKNIPGAQEYAINWVTPSKVAQQVQSIINLPNNSAGLGGMLPGQYRVPGYNEVLNVGGGIGNLFVVAGKSTTSRETKPFFPMGPIISVSDPIDYDQQRRVLANLSNSGITNAWWSPVQTITQTTVPGGINSAGSFQSNIPKGTQHCAGPGPGGRASDTWHYC
jgi:hypothetical protein